MSMQPSKKRHIDDEDLDQPTGSRSGFKPTDYHIYHERTPSPISTHASSECAYAVVHRVECSRLGQYHEHHEPCADYFDVPFLPASASRMTCLRGRDRLVDLESFLEDHINLSFAVYMTYNCVAYHEETKDRFKRIPMPQMDDPIASQAKPYFYILQNDAEPAKPRAEKLILSEGLEKTLQGLHKNAEHSSDEEKNKEYETPDLWQNPANLIYPYLELYSHHQSPVEHMTDRTTSAEQAHISALSSYLEGRLSSEYVEAEAFFERGLVTREHWTKLFRPGAIVVTHESSEPMAYVSTSCPTVSIDALRLDCWSWGFDGKFFKNKITLDVPWPSGIDAETIIITDLDVYPLQYARAGMEQELRSRGEVFWACRSRKFINYNLPIEGMEPHIADLRYMVDTSTYKMMHGDEDVIEDRTELDDNAMRIDDVPAGPFALLLPASIRGYGFHNKKWNRLLVKHIHDIQWNKAAFNHRLVLKEEKKEFIRALISVHIGQQTAVKTDFMDGKGEGLIILLHGGPGTGKTLTAESVAEFAERPLYRVTCGDIGTDPEGVEKYLESVLFIGSTWHCVVVLDEADIFLEERTKMDMQRNALVSVFLRVLEYYDGILILTTNRIGTFDEAFKSRIQLALHFPPLAEAGRREIWHSFMGSLKARGVDADFEEIDKRLHLLAKYTLNGRQIRNTINTARQLAQYKNENLRFVHIDQALRIVDEFEKYVSDVHGHGDEEYAREQGIR